MKLLVVAACFTVLEGVAGGLWISGDTAAPEKPAPVLMKEFVLDSKPAYRNPLLPTEERVKDWR